ncbi:hypothetical protein M9H77_27363 [Catharanthus roseus]|uniref:Uncharacterized protein n=1 Tax=Catharanthus roseus TaxID=4058 RepID=A0ACC0ACH4_CATRO|nr:hypothetical protein M9H77_27363 [Catharanthus roseus]
MVELINKPILVEKRITSLEQYKEMELLLGMGCYNENLVKEFYANLVGEFGNPESPAYGQVYVRGHFIDFSPANVVHYLNCPHYSDIEGTGLKKEVDPDEVTTVLQSDEGAVWPEKNKIHSNLMRILYRALFRVFCGNQLPITNMPAILKERDHQLYAFATKKKINIYTVIFKNIRQIDQKKTRIEVVLMFNGVEDLKGFKVKKLVPRGSLEELKGFQLCSNSRVLRIKGVQVHASTHQGRALKSWRDSTVQCKESLCLFH